MTAYSLEEKLVYCRNSLCITCRTIGWETILLFCNRS